MEGREPIGGHAIRHRHAAGAPCRARTRHLIELGGLQKAGLVELADDDRATLHADRLCAGGDNDTSPADLMARWPWTARLRRQ